MSKPKTKDGVNFSLEGCTLKVLGPDDIILETDFIRELQESILKDGGFDSTFRPDVWRGTRWHKASEELPGWIGDTQRNFYKFRVADEIIPSEYCASHEIVRVIL